MLEPERIYKVSTNQLLASGGHNYTTFNESSGKKNTEHSQLDIIKEYIKGKTHVQSPKDNRINELEPNDGRTEEDHTRTVKETRM